MPRKGKKRRELHRRRKAERQQQVGEAPAAAGPALPAQHARKHPRKPPGAGKRWTRRLPTWALALPVAAAAAVIAGVLVLGGGSSSGGDEAVPMQTPDSRVAGLTPQRTIEVEARGDPNVNSFEPNRIEVSAGEVVEIRVRNVGSVAHNMRISGVDGEYDTADDWVTTPRTFRPGEEGTIVIKIDQAGTYPFRCDLHPSTQTGTLTVR